MNEVGLRIAAVIRAIPRGRTASYGGIAAMAGLRNGARTVARLLHASSSSSGLPWWRVVRSDGGIALARGSGFEEQEARLAAEGVAVGQDGRVDMARFEWRDYVEKPG